MAHTTNPRTAGRDADWARYTSTVQGNSGSVNWTISPVFEIWARDTSMADSLSEMPSCVRMTGWFQPRTLGL